MGSRSVDDLTVELVANDRLGVEGGDIALQLFNHPVVGELSLRFNRLDIAADHGLTLFTYAAEPGSRSEEALNLLGSWAATIDLADSAQTTDQH